MNSELINIARLQGDIRVYLMGIGMDSDEANDAAAEVMHKVLTSNVATAECKTAYADLSAYNEETI